MGTLDYGINPKIRSKCMKIVSCSNLVDVKRVNLIIEALSFLEIPIEWIHFGAGPCAGALKKLANERLNKKNIKYNFQGFVDNKKILMYYLKHHIDLFINVSESEGIPVSIMEAMSFGVPVIATDVGGTGEIVKNDINGFLLNKDFTINELEEKILSVYSKPEDKILELRKNARNTWEAKFNAVKNYTMSVSYTHLDVYKRQDASFVGLKSQKLVRFGISMNKLFDAMMGGKPILYMVDAPNNYITEFDCGVFVKGNSVDDIVKGIDTLLKYDKDELKKMGENLSLIHI